MVKVWILMVMLGSATEKGKCGALFAADMEEELYGALEEHRGFSSGGHVAFIDDYPYVVSITGDVNCTGVIVDSRYVLTTLRCLKKVEKRTKSNEKNSSIQGEATVRVGSDYLDKYGEVKRLKWLYDHPLSDVKPDIYGFVMVELLEPLVVTSELYYETAIFSSLHDPKEERINALVKRGAICTMVGFGDYHSDRRRQARVLHQTPIKILDWSTCKDGNTQIVPEFEICVSLPAYHSNVCANEVGAALVCNKKVYGVLAGFNETCSIFLDRPTKFLRVDQAIGFITFIRGCVDNNDCYNGHSSSLFML